MERLIPIFVFFFVFLIALGTYFLYKDRQTAGKELFRKRVATRKRKSFKETRRMDVRRLRERSRAEDIFSVLLNIPMVEALISQSGINISIDRFLFVSTMCGAASSFVAIFVFSSFFAFVIVMAAGFFVPVLYLMKKRGERTAALVKQLPDVLDFMVRSLRAGQSLDRAFHGVSVNFSDPAGGEIRIIYEEISMGLPFAEALENFENRFPKLADVKFLCASLIIQRETGGNLTEILSSLSNTIRERFRLQRQVKALTAEGRLTSLIIGVLPIVFGAVSYMVNPGYVSRLFIDPMGKNLLFLAIVLEILGFVSMRFLARVKI